MTQLSKTLRRELAVAFAKDSQPVWFRIAKYVLLAVVLYFFWGRRELWIVLGGCLVLALALHFWYRHKTRGWTRSYGLWKYDGRGAD
jgi:hypothetical protein